MDYIIRISYWSAPEEESLITYFRYETSMSVVISEILGRFDAIISLEIKDISK